MVVRPSAGTELRREGPGSARLGLCSEKKTRRLGELAPCSHTLGRGLTAGPAQGAEAGPAGYPPGAPRPGRDPDGGGTKSTQSESTQSESTLGRGLGPVQVPFEPSIARAHRQVLMYLSNVARTCLGVELGANQHSCVQVGAAAS